MKNCNKKILLKISLRIYFSFTLTKPIIEIIVINKIGKKTDTIGGIFPVLPNERKT